MLAFFPLSMSFLNPEILMLVEFLAFFGTFELGSLLCGVAPPIHADFRSGYSGLWCSWNNHRRNHYGI